MSRKQAPFLTQHDGSWSGKVRDIYIFGDKLLIVVSDRISTYDVVHPTSIPDKGRILNQLSRFWFEKLNVPHHMITTNLDEMHKFERRIDFGFDRDYYEGRSMLVWRAKVFPVECVVRGYLSGSGWSDYQKTGKVCGIPLLPSYRESEKLPFPIFTPATKAEQGEHDANISFDEMVRGPLQNDRLLAITLQEVSTKAYQAGAAYALERGIIIADTKFEFGRRDDQLPLLMLVDEVLTPDSSRFWPVDQYKPGGPQPSYDKQFVRDHVTGLGWNKKPPAPELPPSIVSQTHSRYIEAYERLTEQSFPWG